MGALVDLPTRLNCHSCSCTIHNPAHPPCLCSTETPEGQACGLVKNLALMTYISVGCPSNPVLDFLSVSAGGGWWHYSIYSFRGRYASTDQLPLCQLVPQPAPRLPCLAQEWATEDLEEISPSVVPKATKIFVNGGQWPGQAGLGRWLDRVHSNQTSLVSCFGPAAT